MGIISSAAGWLLKLVGARVVENFTDRAMQRIGLMDATCQRCSAIKYGVEVVESRPTTLVCQQCGHQGTILIESVDSLVIHQVQFASIIVQQASISIGQAVTQQYSLNRLPEPACASDSQQTRSAVSRVEFGEYILLKKLTEDLLGETFRARRIRQGLESIVLLQIFNGKKLDREALWSKVSGRSPIQDFTHPNIGTCVDVGRVRGVPFIAYDYHSGTNLATFFDRATLQFSPIPTDLALLVAERLSLALAAAFEVRAQGQRMLHGFVVPLQVMVSNEGEIRLLGFEVASGLRNLALGNWHDETTRPYLAPEILAGSSPDKSDDVYSLGAILFELLTGERIPTASAVSWSAVIDSALLANERVPLPDTVAGLLKWSLAPRENRISDAVIWHKTLSRIIVEGHYCPTTFNLAFLIHNLFRKEIEIEMQEIKAEKAL